MVHFRVMAKKLVGVIIPDVHEKIGTLKTLVEKYDPQVDWIAFLGDWFDSFRGLTWETHETTRWLAENLFNPKYVFLWGNHDLHYAYPINGLVCSGFDPKKLAIIQNHFTNKHWKQFKLMHFLGEQPEPNENRSEWLLSHAGLHPYFIHPVKGWDRKFLAEKSELAMYSVAFERTAAPLIQVGRGRGGDARVGGVVWLDWNQEFEPIADLNQIVGHTPGDTVRTKVLRDKSNDPDKHGTITSMNYNLDTHLNHVLLVYDDSFVIESI